MPRIAIALGFCFFVYYYELRLLCDTRWEENMWRPSESRWMMKNDNTDRDGWKRMHPGASVNPWKFLYKIFICDCVEFIGESRNNGLINDQSQPVQTEVADAGDDHRVLYVIDKSPPPKPSRTAKTREAKEPKSYCSQQVRGPDYDHHQTHPHSHGV